jgi:hypothetical protein
MAYEFVKQGGRVNFYKDGEFDHQQFRGHYGFRNPSAYIADLIRWDAEAVEYAAEQRAARVEALAPYLAIRTARAELAARQFCMEF